MRDTSKLPFIATTPSLLRSKLVAFLRDNSVIHAEDESIVSSSGSSARWLIDTRIALFNPEMSFAIASLFWEYLEKRLPFQLCCVEMTGIPLMTSIQAFALRRGQAVNGFVIRKERKDTGRQRQIEGTINDQPIIFVDDIINGGNSIVFAQVALSKIERHLVHVVALIDFGTARIGDQLLHSGISLKSLINLDELGVNKAALPAQKTQERQIFRELWRLDPGDPKSLDLVPKSTPTFDDDYLYYGTDSGNFYAVDSRTGVIQWKFAAGTDKYKGIRSSPLIYGDLVYFGAYDGVFYALERSSGRPKWQFVEADWIGSSPCCSPILGRVFVGLEHAMPGRRGNLVALDSCSGERCWELPIEGLVHCSPCYVEKLGCVVVGSNTGEVFCADAATGELRWSAKTNGPIKAKPTYDDKTGLVICGSFDKHVYAWRANTGEVAWKVATQAIIYSEPLVHQDLVYVCSTDKHLYALSVGNGKPVFKYFAGAKLFSSPSRWHARMYFSSTAGNIFEFDLDTQLLTGIHIMAEKIANKIVCDERNDRCYITTIDGQLCACERR
jgi:outer membrane protein assembly factor BamB/orotate phosphoribosyltransferase